MIVATSGAELCATSLRKNVRPTDCVRAKDHTYKGVVDLTARVSVGEPIHDGAPLRWKVPYNVMDDAGNKAKTVWRSIIVEEVGLDDFESSNDAAILTNRREEVDHAVREALEKERKRVAVASNNKHQVCPPCAPCNCKGKKDCSGLSTSECNSICDRKLAAAAASSGASCPPMYLERSTSHEMSEYKITQTLKNYLESLIGPSSMELLFVACFVTVMLYILQRLIRALFFSSGPYVRTYYADEERERMMMQNVSYYRSPTATTTTRPAPTSTPSSSVSRPPTASLSSQRNGIFSPTQQQQQTEQYTSPFRSNDGTDNAIYQSVSPITPRRKDAGPSPPGYNLRSNR